MPDDPVAVHIRQMLAEDGLDPAMYSQLWEAMEAGFQHAGREAAEAFLAGFLAVARPRLPCRPKSSHGAS